MNTILNVKNVTKIYGPNTVLKDVSLSCEAGKIYGLVGRNGSGKTVLLKCICGLTTPTCGEIKVRGKQVGKDVDFPENIGFIIESPGFLLHESGMGNLRHLASIRRKIGVDEIRSTMELVGLDPDTKKPVGKYSLGMRQRLGIAQAIMEKPDLLILDEPMNGLDNQGVAHIRSVLLSMKAQGVTIVLASHFKEDIAFLCDEVYQMDGGVLTMTTMGNGDFISSENPNIDTEEFHKYKEIVGTINLDEPAKQRILDVICKN